MQKKLFVFTWGFDINLSSANSINWSKAIQWVTEGIDGTSEEAGSDWNIDNSAGTLDGVTFFDQTIVTEHDNTDVITFQVQRLKMT